MYIRGDYSVVRYGKLLELKEKLKEGAPELNPQLMDFSPEVCRRFLVEELNVYHVRNGLNGKVSLRGNKWLSIEVSVAMRVVVRETEKYLAKYQERFEQDVQDGKLEGCVSGEQLEFDFKEGIPCGVDLGQERMSREEVRGVFRRRK